MPSALPARTRGLVALLAGGAAIAFAPIFVRLADTSPAASAFWRVALATIPLGLWAATAENASSEKAKVSQPLVLAGLCFAGDLAAWHLSIAYTTVANATLEANLAPIFVTLGAWVLFGQRVTRAFLAALAITVVGAVLLVGPNFVRGGEALLGDALGVLTAIFYAGYLLAVSRASLGASVPRIALTSTTVSAIALLPYAMATSAIFWPQSAQGWLVLVGLALIAHTLGQSLIAYGLGRVPSALGAVTLLIQPVLAAFYAWVLLGESMGAIQALGALVVLIGIYLARRAS